MKNSLITRLYGFGSNGAGQLGVGHQDDLTYPQLCRFTSFAETPIPDGKISVQQSLEGHTIIKLVAGGNHTLVLTESGQVYACGNNSDGRCGMPPVHKSLTDFTLVSWAATKKITNIAATWEASFLVADSHAVWVCGTGSKGELASGEKVSQSCEPRQILDITNSGDGDARIVDIIGSMGHVVILLSTGHAYGWGSSRKGQLGPILQDQKVVWNPEKLQLPFAVTGSALGRDFTYFWNADQEAILFGVLNAGKGPNINAITCGHPQCVAGWSTLYAMQDGTLQGVGEGRRGQLPPADLPRLTKVSAGSEHCVAVTEDGRIVTWGWGEHGNCGVPTDSRGNVSDCFNEIQLAEEQHAISGIGAGCASSFIWTTDVESR